MPSLRLATRQRRRSSHTIFTPARPGIYGIPPAARPMSTVTFAPNVTPTTFTSADPDDTADPSNSNPHSSYALAAAIGNPSASGLLPSNLFSLNETPALPPTTTRRKRCPPGKRRSQGYIPRPPNAFMLFRADFVKQRHIPGSIETNNGGLSKIVGAYWHQLPLEEKKIWEVRAKQEKAAHKAMFPNYRFKPVHNKNKNKHIASPSYSDNNSSEEVDRTANNERRCDEVTQLLLDGQEGGELERAVRDLDSAQSLQHERGEHVRERKMAEEYELELELEGEEQEHDDFAGEDLQGVRNLDGQGHLYIRAPVSAPVFINPFASSPFASNTHLYAPTAPFASNNNGSHNIYHRRSSSVPLPNEWQSYAHAQTSFSQFGSAFNEPRSGNGIAMLTIPQFAFTSLSRPISPNGSIAQFNDDLQPTDPFQSVSTSILASFNETPTPTTNSAGEHAFAPVPEFSASSVSSTTATASQLFYPVPQHPHVSAHAHDHDYSSSAQYRFSINPVYPAQPMQMQMHHPAPMVPFMTQTTPRSSLGQGLGQRRASSAQGVLMRAAWPGMQGVFDYAPMGGYAGMGDSIPSQQLPDVQAGLFNSDFSFGGEAQAQTQYQPSSVSSSTPTDFGGRTFLSPPVVGSSDSAHANVDANANNNGNGNDTVQEGNAPGVEATGFPSLDISAYMHMNGVYASDSGVGTFDQLGQYPQQQQQGDGYTEYHGYEVNPVAVMGMDGYYEANA